MKTRILTEQNSRLTTLPLPLDETSFQVGIAEGHQTQVPLIDWIGNDPAAFSPGGQNPHVQTTPTSSSFTFSLTGAQSTVQNVYFDRAPYEGSANTTRAVQTQGYRPLPGP